MQPATRVASDEDDGGPLALLAWRREVAGLYAAVRGARDAEKAWEAWRDGRDRLVRTHPQSPLELSARRAFGGLPFFGYDRDLRIQADVTPMDGSPIALEGGTDGPVRMRPFGRTHGLAGRLGGELTLFWIMGYGGGLFLPFADATNRQETYGAGRYLLDTIKGADLGTDGSGRLILDFNFAYNPSCSYSPRYVCPLAPPSNRLSVPVRAGERVAP